MPEAGLREAYAVLLDATPRSSPPPPGEWDTGQILAHVSLVTAATIGAVSSVAAGAVSTYDNRLAQDPWTLARVARLAGGVDGLRARIRTQAEALCLLAGALSEAELAVPLPSLLTSNGECLVDGPLTVRDILAGLAANELPGHTAQL
ncbi:DinB family protein [Dactylosporangium sp. NPDC000244]|uniref:DinB family protein n=1 Tax=Dactylosporangium sp. NPDC000244 TaxID=3154365 RepID=UPI003321C4C3